MNHRFKHLLLPIACCLLHVAHGQLPRHKIALFTPLFLDSAFDATGNYVFTKNYPRYFNPGVDFYLGAQAALDSLQKRGEPLEVFVYDTRSSDDISDPLDKPELKDVEMIIAQSNLSETRSLADVAQKRKIPFISATLPNDASVTDNPYFVMLNSSLQTHVQGIYKLLQKDFNKERIIVFTKNGVQEDQVKNYLTEYGKETIAAPVNIKFINIGDDFSGQTLAAQLDSTRKNVCIAGGLDENFGMRLSQTLASLTKTYPITLIGMPTWESFNFNKSVASLEIIYGSPFYFNRPSFLQTKIANDYSAKMNNRPGDLFFRGYETMMRFGLLLLHTTEDVASNLSKKGSNIFTQFDIQPVFRDKKMTLDYFENKHLYFIRLFGGSRTLFSQ